MAKKRKQRTETAARHDLVRLCAFIGIVISATIFVVSGCLNLFGADLGALAGLLNMIASLALLVAVAFPAWEFVRGKTQAWRIVYWVALVVYIVGCVFGLVSFGRLL